MVDFVYKCENRNPAFFTNSEKLFGLRFHAFCHVNQHDSAVGSHQGAVRVFREVLVTRRIQNVDAAPVVVEL